MMRNNAERNDLLPLNSGLPLEVYEAGGDARHRLFVTRTPEESQAVVVACLAARERTVADEAADRAARELAGDRSEWERLFQRYGPAGPPAGDAKGDAHDTRT